jgi:DNA-binding transcriptional regulator YhcF (GntR family)
MQAAFTPGAPIYVQISDDIRQRIASGQWPPGMRMPPVRELSIDLGVNPNTAQRSLAELEREGLVFTERTAGRFITKDAGVIKKVKDDMAAEYAGQFYLKMRAIGYERDEIVGIVRAAADSEEAGA